MRHLHLDHQGTVAAHVQAATTPSRTIISVHRRKNNGHQPIPGGCSESGTRRTLAGGQSVTYHDPCHLKNSLGVTAQPRTLIKAVRLRLQGNDRCGHLLRLRRQLQHRPLRPVQEDRLHARRTTSSPPAQSVAATSCPACMIQITDMLSQKGAPVWASNMSSNSMPTPCRLPDQ